MTLAHSLDRRRLQSVDPLARSLLEGLVAFWRLDYTPSGGLVDSSGNALTLADNNTVTAADGPGGRIPYATHFTRTASEYLSIVDNALLSGGDRDFTVAAWVYKDSSPAANSYMGIIDKSKTVGQREYALAIANDATSHAFYFDVSNNGTATVAIRSTSGLTATATWYFVMAWHDSVNNTINIQINDGDVDSAAHTTGVFDGTDSLTIGVTGGITTHFWDGRIAQPVRWNRLLTPQERTYLYANGAARDLIPGIGFV